MVMAFTTSSNLSIIFNRKLSKRVKFYVEYNRHLVNIRFYIEVAI